MRKTVKKPPSPMNSMNMNEPDEYVSQEQTYQEIRDAGTSSSSQNPTENRQNRINELIQQMQSLNMEQNDGRNLADFKPLSHPAVNTKKENVLDTSTESLAYFPPVNLGISHPRPTERPTFSANNLDLDKNSDYRMVYQPPPKINSVPSYSGNATSLPRTDDKLLDKINYMIHLLEEQANEKTNNVMEEFVMFSLVGVFLIYVLDSFSRSGKYTR
jgi:hypothetical protein